jgi:hypothetical protein
MDTEPSGATPQNRYQGALEDILADLDYDLYKGILSDEETGENGFPALAAKFAGLVGDEPEGVS